MKTKKSQQIEDVKQIIKDVICEENERSNKEGWDVPLCTAPSYLAEKLAERLCASECCKPSEEGAECPACHGTGRIGTTDWLTKNMSKKQLAEEKAKAIAEHEQYIKNVAVIEVLTKIEISTKAVISFVEDDTFASEEIRKAKLEAYKDTLNHVNKLKRQFAKETKR